MRFSSLQRFQYQGPVSPRLFLCLALSALALSHRFSGFRSLLLFEFISPRNTLGILLQSFLLQEIGGFFFSDFVGFRSSIHLLSLAATRSCSRVGFVTRVVTKALQCDFRGLFPLTARSIGSRVSWLRWSMLSWFSHPLQGYFFFALRSPCNDHYRCNTSVTSPALTVYTNLLSPPLALWSSLVLAGWFHSTLPRLASSFACLTPLTLSGSPHHPLTSSLRLPFGSRFLLVSASCVTSFRTYRLSLIFASSFPFARSRSFRVSSL